MSPASAVDIQIDFLHFIMVVPVLLSTLSAKPTAGAFSDAQESGIKLPENASLISVILLKYRQSKQEIIRIGLLS